jgi:hypothetical protein
MKRNVSVVCGSVVRLIVATRSSGPTEMPVSVVSGTLFVYIYIYIYIYMYKSAYITRKMEALFFLAHGYYFSIANCRKRNPPVFKGIFEIFALFKAFNPLCSNFEVSHPRCVYSIQIVQCIKQSEHNCIQKGYM